MNTEEYNLYLEEVIKELRARLSKYENNHDPRTEQKMYCLSCLESFEEIDRRKKTKAASLLEGCLIGVTVVILGFAIFVIAALLN